MRLPLPAPARQDGILAVSRYAPVLPVQSSRPVSVHRSTKPGVRAFAAVGAFEAVIKKTGHPTSEEFIRELQFAVDLFRPSFDEEQGHDLANNCRRA